SPKAEKKEWCLILWLLELLWWRRQMSLIGVTNVSCLMLLVKKIKQEEEEPDDNDNDVCMMGCSTISQQGATSTE
ncbi:hypothetical protein KI387_006645, partial [Taxus chinensis]